MIGIIIKADNTKITGLASSKLVISFLTAAKIKIHYKFTIVEEQRRPIISVGQRNKIALAATF